MSRCWVEFCGSEIPNRWNPALVGKSYKPKKRTCQFGSVPIIRCVSSVKGLKCFRQNTTTKRWYSLSPDPRNCSIIKKPHLQVSGNALCCASGGQESREECARRIHSDVKIPKECETHILNHMRCTCFACMTFACKWRQGIKEEFKRRTEDPIRCRRQPHRWMPIMARKSPEKLCYNEAGNVQSIYCSRSLSRQPRKSPKVPWWFGNNAPSSESETKTLTNAKKQRPDGFESVTLDGTVRPTRMSKLSQRLPFCEDPAFQTYVKNCSSSNEASQRKGLTNRRRHLYQGIVTDDGNESKKSVSRERDKVKGFGSFANERASFAKKIHDNFQERTSSLKQRETSLEGFENSSKRYPGLDYFNTSDKYLEDVRVISPKRRNGLGDSSYGSAKSGRNWSNSWKIYGDIDSSLQDFRNSFDDDRKIRDFSDRLQNSDRIVQDVRDKYCTDQSDRMVQDVKDKYCSDLQKREPEADYSNSDRWMRDIKEKWDVKGNKLRDFRDKPSVRDRRLQYYRGDFSNIYCQVRKFRENSFNKMCNLSDFGESLDKRNLRLGDFGENLGKSEYRFGDLKDSSVRTAYKVGKLREILGNYYRRYGVLRARNSSRPTTECSFENSEDNFAKINHSVGDCRESTGNIESSNFREKLASGNFSFTNVRKKFGNFDPSLENVKDCINKRDLRYQSYKKNAINSCSNKDNIRENYVFNDCKLGEMDDKLCESGSVLPEYNENLVISQYRDLGDEFSSSKNKFEGSVENLANRNVKYQNSIDNRTESKFYSENIRDSPSYCESYQNGRDTTVRRSSTRENLHKQRNCGMDQRHLPFKSNKISNQINQSPKFYKKYEDNVPMTTNKNKTISEHSVSNKRKYGRLSSQRRSKTRLGDLTKNKMSDGLTVYDDGANDESLPGEEEYHDRCFSEDNLCARHERPLRHDDYSCKVVHPNKNSSISSSRLGRCEEQDVECYKQSGRHSYQHSHCHYHHHSSPSVNSINDNESLKRYNSEHSSRHWKNQRNVGRDNSNLIKYDKRHMSSLNKNVTKRVSDSDMNKIHQAVTENHKNESWMNSLGFEGREDSKHKSNGESKLCTTREGNVKTDTIFTTWTSLSPDKRSRYSSCSNSHTSTHSSPKITKSRTHVNLSCGDGVNDEEEERKSICPSKSLRRSQCDLNVSHAEEGFMKKNTNQTVNTDEAFFSPSPGYLRKDKCKVEQHLFRPSERVMTEPRPRSKPEWLDKHLSLMTECSHARQENAKSRMKRIVNKTNILSRSTENIHLDFTDLNQRLDQVKHSQKRYLEQVEQVITRMKERKTTHSNLNKNLENCITERNRSENTRPRVLLYHKQKLPNNIRHSRRPNETGQDTDSSSDQEIEMSTRQQNKAFYSPENGVEDSRKN